MVVRVSVRAHTHSHPPTPAHTRTNTAAAAAATHTRLQKNTTQPDLRTMAPEMRVASPGLARALYEIFLGDDSVVAPARAVWAAGARELLDSENVKRDVRKSSM